MKEMTAGGCVYIVGNFSFSRLPEEEQLVVVPFAWLAWWMRLWMTASGGRGSTEVQLQYAGFREEDLVESCLSYTSISLYKRYMW